MGAALKTPALPGYGSWSGRSLSNPGSVAPQCHPAGFNCADSLRRFVRQVSEKRGETVIATETEARITSQRLVGLVILLTPLLPPMRVTVTANRAKRYAHSPRQLFGWRSTEPAVQHGSSYTELGFH